MDDFIIIHPHKDHLHRLLAAIRTYLTNTLALSLNQRTTIFPVHPTRGRGLDFLGHHLWPTHRRLRQSSIRRIQRCIRQAQRTHATGKLNRTRTTAQLQSWQAHAAHGQTIGLQRAILDTTRLIQLGLEPMPPRRI
jgi:hypothetical protein